MVHLSLEMGGFIVAKKKEVTSGDDVWVVVGN